MKIELSHGHMWMQILAIAVLLFLTLLPVEVRWDDASVWLTMVMPALGVMGFAGLMLHKSKANVSATDILVALWALYYLFRAYIGTEYPCATEELKACSTILLYAMMRIVFHKTRLTAWWLIIGIILCGCYESIYGIMQLTMGNSRHHLFLLTGNFQNPGPYSAYLMIAAVVGLTVMQKSKLIMIATLVILMVLPSTWSRAAFAGMAACALWIFNDKYWKYRYYVWTGLVLCAIVFYLIKQGSADGRALTWVASLTSWTHAPWLGVGIGGFRHACAEGIAETWNAHPGSQLFDSAGVTDYAYNTLLKILVEQGMVGAIICTTTTMTAMGHLYHRSKPLFAGMLSLLIFSMFSYPFELMPYRMIGIAIIAWSESGHADAVKDNLPRKIHFTIGRSWATIYTSAFIISSIYICHETKRRKKADEETILFSGMHNAAFIVDYNEALPDATDNPQFLFDYAMTLRDDERFQDSNAILRNGIQVSADPMFYVIIGNNYEDEGYYDLAEAAYQKAYHVMPNRLYPLYKLMLLYEDTGEADKCISIAKKIREKKPKVESPATIEMQNKADSIIHHKLKNIDNIKQCINRDEKNKLCKTAQSVTA